MREQFSGRDRQGAWLAVGVALFLLSACGGPGAKSTGQSGTGGEGDTGGDVGSGGDGGGSGSGGNAGKGGAGGGGKAGMGGDTGTAGAGGGGGGDATPDAAPPDEPDASGGMSGAGGSDDAGAGGADGIACGAAGQMCCAGNMCSGGAKPMVTAGGGGGMTVVEYHASGGDPYKLFQEKMMWPIDGPDSGYITDTGTSFKFVLHQTGAEETVSSGAHRQRNELTVNPGNPTIYKGLEGSTMSYTWRFHLDTINAHPTWCTVFQIKQHGPLGVAPLFQMRAVGDNLEFAFRQTTAKSLPLTQFLGQWISASLTIKYGHAGALELHLKKADGSALLDYKNDNADMWDANTDFVRPKWGLYRNQKDGAGEASIQYNDMKIIHGAAGTDDACTCR